MCIETLLEEIEERQDKTFKRIYGDYDPENLEQRICKERQEAFREGVLIYGSAVILERAKTWIEGKEEEVAREKYKKKWELGKNYVQGAKDLIDYLNKILKEVEK